MPGGKIAPDGRPAQAPGVGKNSKRHDLEAPATPGLHGSDLQQGDVQMLEQGQQVAPRPKRTQPSAAPNPRGRQRAAAQGAPMQVPDPIQFASNRYGGQSIPESTNSVGLQIDPAPWMPLLAEFASRPGGNPQLAALYLQQLSNLRRKNISSQPHLINMMEIDDTLAGS